MLCENGLIGLCGVATMGKDRKNGSFYGQSISQKPYSYSRVLVIVVVKLILFHSLLDIARIAESLMPRFKTLLIVGVSFHE